MAADTGSESRIIGARGVGMTTAYAVLMRGPAPDAVDVLTYTAVGP